MGKFTINGHFQELFWQRVHDHAPFRWSFWARNFQFPDKEDSERRTPTRFGVGNVDAAISSLRESKTHGFPNKFPTSTRAGFIASSIFFRSLCRCAASLKKESGKLRRCAVARLHQLWDLKIAERLDFGFPAILRPATTGTSWFRAWWLGWWGLLVVFGGWTSLLRIWAAKHFMIS